MLKAMADNNVNITTKEDASVYDALAGKREGILKGIGNELKIIHDATNTIKLSTGEAVLQGRHITETDGTTSLILPLNSTGFVVLRYDLTQSAGKEAALTTTPSPLSEDLNNDGKIRDLILGKYTTGDTGVTNFEDLRKYYRPNMMTANVEVTLPTSWSNNMQTVSVPSVTAEDSPILDVKLTGSISEMEIVLEEWSKILKAETGNGTITFTCKEPTTVPLTVLVKGI